MRTNQSTWAALDVLGPAYEAAGQLPLSSVAASLAPASSALLAEVEPLLPSVALSNEALRIYFFLHCH